MDYLNMIINILFGGGKEKIAGTTKKYQLPK